MLIKKISKFIYLNALSSCLSKFKHKKSIVDNELISDYAMLAKIHFNKLPAQPTNLKFSSINEWNSNLNELKENVQSYNLTNFLRWNVIQRTMFVVHAKYSSYEFDYLKNLTDWESRWKPAIHETQIGNPPPFIHYMMTSCNLLHHGYHLASFETWLGSKVTDTDVVLEFGGGYGSMCRLFFQLNFKGVYIIYDLPHFSILQEFFLKSLGLKQLSIYEVLNGKTGGFCTISSDTKDLLFKFLKESKSNKTLIATWSLSEAPIEERKPFVDNLGVFDKFLIAYQNQFNETNNISFFKQQNSSISHTLETKEISFLKDNYYFYGRK